MKKPKDTGTLGFTPSTDIFSEESVLSLIDDGAPLRILNGVISVLEGYDLSVSYGGHPSISWRKSQGPQSNANQICGSPSTISLTDKEIVLLLEWYRFTEHEGFATEEDEELVEKLKLMQGRTNNLGSLWKKD